jgi:tetratricopeptide (TPR) repeat protein
MKKYLLILFLTTSQLFAQETAEENAKLAFEFVMAGENADEFITKAIELNKDYPLTYVSRGLQYQYLKKDIALALKDFDLAIKLDDKTGFALYFKALILLENDKQKACELIQKAKELNNYMALSFTKCD